MNRTAPSTSPRVRLVQEDAPDLTVNGLTDHHPRADRLAYSPMEAADLLSVGRSTIYSLLADGRLRSVRSGRRRLVPHEALVEFLNREA